MTEAVKHTKGPWFLEGHWIADGKKIGGWVSCNPQVGIPVFELMPVIGKPKEIISNARLIAAAPDLYEALSALQLQALQSSVNHAGNEWGLEALAMTKAAIAKAEGRS